MSNEKFTAGTFRRAFNMSRNGKTARGLSPCRIENEKGVVIAFTVPQKSRKEQIANTNLLAAAPNMYERLKGVRCFLWTCLQYMQYTDSLYKQIEYQVKMIDEVLKKARGGE